MSSRKSPNKWTYLIINRTYYNKLAADSTERVISFQHSYWSVFYGPPLSLVEIENPTNSSRWSQLSWALHFYFAEVGLCLASGCAVSPASNLLLWVWKRLGQGLNHWRHCAPQLSCIWSLIWLFWRDSQAPSWHFYLKWCLLFTYCELLHRQHDL